MSAIRSLILAALLTSSLLMGCSPASVGMVEVDYDAALYRPPEDRALLLLAPGTMDRPAVIIDEDGAFVASVRRRMHAILPVEPGRRALYVIGPNNIVPLLVDFEAGRLYAVALSAERRMTSVGEKSILEVLPLTRSSNDFDAFVGNVRGTRPCGVSTAEAERWMSEHREEIPDLISRGRVAWVAGGAAYQARHSIEAGRGLTERHTALFARRER